MADNNDFSRNTVSSKGQLIDSDSVTFYMKENAKLNVLFVGNSITRHSVCESIGWHRDCGMAASSPEKDYVHLVVHALEEQINAPVSFCIAQVADWEREYYNDAILDAQYAAARAFEADIVIIRAGENTGFPDEHLIEHNYYAHFAAMADFFIGNATKKVITSLFWGRDAIDREIKKVAEDRGYPYVPIHHLGLRDDCKAIGEYEHQGVALHPGDLGMKEIADAILKNL